MSTYSDEGHDRDSQFDDLDLPDLSELFRELTPDPARSGPTHERSASLGGGPSGHGVGANRQRTIGGQASLDSHQGSISQPSVPSLPGMLSPFHMSVSSPAPSAIEPLSPISTGSQEALNLRIPTGPLNSHQAIGGSQGTVPPPAQHGGAGQSHFNSRGGRGGRRCRGRRRFRPYGNIQIHARQVINCFQDDTATVDLDTRTRVTPDCVAIATTD